MKHKFLTNENKLSPATITYRVALLAFNLHLLCQDRPEEVCLNSLDILE